MERPQISNTLMDKMAPGCRIDIVTCKEVPGDEPVVHFINQLDPLKSTPGITVSKICHRTKIQVYI